jgi:hypothetical protein
MTKARTTSSMTRNQRRKNGEVLSEVKLRKVVPDVPRNETERGELLEDLQTMGCSGLLEKPWDFKDDQIVRELLDGVSNEFDNSIRATLAQWTEECWREVYNFSTGDGGMAGWKDEYVKIASKRCPAPRMDMPSKTARIHSIGVSSFSSSPSSIRKSQTGLRLPWVTQFSEH